MSSGIHISDIRAYRACRRKWDWSSPLRNNLEPNIAYPPFFIGRALHHCLEKFYAEGISVWDSLDEFLNEEQKVAGHMWRSEQEKWDDAVMLLQEMMAHYALWIQVDTSDFRDENLEFIKLEVPFEVPMPIPGTDQVDERMTLQGRFDGIVRHKPTDTYWIWETKTTRSLSELIRSLDNDEQSGVYFYAAQRLYGIKTVGVLYNMLRKKAPNHPKILQSGYLSKRASADLTSFSFVADVKKTHGDVSWEFIKEYYGDYISELSISNNGFFTRYPIRRSSVEINNLLTGVYQTAVEMINPDTFIYPAPSLTQCNWCFFKAPCLAKNKGINVDVILDMEYQNRTSAESVRVVEEDESTI